MTLLAVLVTSMFSTAAFAAISKQAVKKSVTPFLSQSSAVIGGQAQGPQAILDIRHSADKKTKVERIVIDLGTPEGKPLLGKVGYYHMEFKKEPAKVILDLSLTPISKVTQDQLVQKLQKTLAIKKSTLMLDPVTSNLNLTFDLQKGTKARVFQVAGSKSASKIVIDLISQ